ncbi:MAG: Tim44-like domain-containing protein, partial [Verrucomicrobiota bacterium]|nr:Tim44-like domain-containing protein [Verrucomicrobiota bacterium]
PKEHVSVRLVYEANYTEVTVTGERAVYSRQAWVLSRRAGVLSPEPDRINSLDCVGCGSPLEPQPDGTCTHCGNQYERGEHHWFVTGIDELNRREVGPALTSKAADVGLNLHTVHDFNLERHRAQLIETYPDMDFQVTIARFQHIYHTLQKAWSEQDLDQLRPFETDSLFQNHRYWVEEYKRQNLRNVLKDVSLDNLELVKVRSDKFYDAITCRLFASMIDYTQDEEGKVMCGSTSRSTRFSEYWTFVRGRGASENTKGVTVCPNCAAELKISMAGECEYCGSKLTSGKFDWVLSEIQQDEEYAG